MHDGHYTVVGYHDHYTFKVKTQPDDAAFAPGKQVLAYLFGPNNESDYKSLAFIVGNELRIWTRYKSGYERIIAAARFLLAGKADEAGRAYALESGNCYICNRLLTEPSSIAAGIGPVCASRIAS